MNWNSVIFRECNSHVSNFDIFPTLSKWVVEVNWAGSNSLEDMRKISFEKNLLGVGN